MSDRCKEFREMSPGGSEMATSGVRGRNTRPGLMIT